MERLRDQDAGITDNRICFLVVLATYGECQFFVCPGRADVIDSRIRGVLYDGRDPRRVLRYPPIEIMHEVPGQRLWFPVPGMYGGFDISLVQEFLDVKSWCRVVGASGQAHLITTEGAMLLDEGFV
jgi:hypothetical protein